ncbi:MAG TPA: Mrr restriction system protein [Rectinema sp.]|jgi:restriction system protein|nr:Mrr restriction system protein [Rectinema sp.]
MSRKIPIERIGEMMKVVLTELQNAGGQARLKDLLPKAEPKLNLTDYEREPYEKSGYIRWQSIVHFYSIDCVKAGYIQKSGGKWYLTPDGEKALQMPSDQFIKSATAKYRDWKISKAKSSGPIPEIEEESDEDKAVRQTAYDQAVEQAREEIERHINDMGPYDFQKLVEELLKAMGYYVPFNAKPGRDGGIDLAAYKDALGITPPRIKVQVKHRDQKMSVKEVRELEGLLRKEGDIGLIVSSGGFTSEVEREIRASIKHIETMDLDRLISLWQQHYGNVSEAGKSLLPLVKLYFLAPAEE